MVEVKNASLREIEKYHAALYATFKAGKCRPLEYRRNQIHQVARMVQENADAFADALHKDIGKPELEAKAFEIGGVVERALKHAEKLEEWSKSETVEVPDYQKPWLPAVHKTPKGPILIITPWNYPVVLNLTSLISAMSAGCPAVLKPSELTPATSRLMAELFPKYLDTKAYVVVIGAVPETTKLLELKWAHISYTGNGRVARIIAAAAAKHLTPVTLELGGKSPVIVDAAYDMKIAAKRILFGKLANAGQTCVAPDYILVQKEKQTELIEAMKEHLKEFYPEGSALHSTSYGRIVTSLHFARLKGLLSRTKGKIVYGGGMKEDSLKMEPTIVANVTGNDSLMDEEIFGPLLPIIPVANLDEAIDFVNSRDHPLAFYAFTDDPSLKKKLVEETLSGGLFFNDTLQQGAVLEIPFGGIGDSGYGNQGMKYGFDDFTHMRASIDMPKEAEAFLGIRYPPYTDENIKILSASVSAPIPAVNGH